MSGLQRNAMCRPPALQTEGLEDALESRGEVRQRAKHGTFLVKPAGLPVLGAKSMGAAIYVIGAAR